MSNYPVGRPPRSADPQSRLRLAALSAVIAGVVLLAAAAFVLSYSGIHQVALQAGVSPSLAKLYPVIFDAMLVVAGAAAMALRGAGWWPRFYAWACLIVLLAAVATGDAVHATGTKLPERASRAAVAITPWVLLLAAFGLLLAMLQYFRTARAAVAVRQAALSDAGPADRGTAARRAEAGPAALPAGTGTAALPTGTGPALPTGTGPARPAGTGPDARPTGTGATPLAADAGAAAVVPAAVTWAGAAGTGGRAVPETHTSLVDLLLGPRTGEPPAVELPDGAGQQDDPVSYGAETGYVHPDSYRDEGEYSPHGDSGGPGPYAVEGGQLGRTEQAAGANGQAGADSTAGREEQANEADAAGSAATAAEDGPAATAPVSGSATKDGPATKAASAATAAVDSPATKAAPAVHAPDAAQGPDANQEPDAAHEQDGATGELPGAEEPALERMRSTPARPEE